jgi:hypothetical protein
LTELRNIMAGAISGLGVAAVQENWINAKLI